MYVSVCNDCVDTAKYLHRYLHWSCLTFWNVVSPWNRQESRLLLDIEHHHHLSSLRWSPGFRSGQHWMLRWQPSWGPLTKSGSLLHILGPHLQLTDSDCWVGKWKGHWEFAFISQLLFPFAHLWESLLRAVRRAEPRLLKLKGAEKLPLSKRQDLAGSCHQSLEPRGIIPRLASEVSSQQEKGLRDWGNNLLYSAVLRRAGRGESLEQSSLFPVA